MRAGQDSILPPLPGGVLEVPGSSCVFLRFLGVSGVDLGPHGDDLELI